MIHIYRGNGKGKTTAAMGLALRALGRGWRVEIVQFLKSGNSGEVAMLESMPGATVRSGKGSAKFTFAMDDDDRARARSVHDEHLAAALDEVESALSDAVSRPANDNGTAAPGADDAPGVLLVLDEALDALAAGLLNEELVARALNASAAGAEVVLTGRAAPAFVEDAADYITCMECVRHPYSRGVGARKGVEL